MDTQNITYAHLARHAAEERTRSGAHTELSPSHNCHNPTISAAGPSRRNPLSSNFPYEAMLKRSNALLSFFFFFSLRITMDMLMKLDISRDHRDSINNLCGV